FFVWSTFFFSSRRRHTRFSRDWSSDVCSSDLLLPKNPQVSSRAWRAPSLRRKSLPWPLGPTLAETPQSIRRGAAPRSRRNQVVQIGRASCRERVENAGVAGSR